MGNRERCRRRGSSGLYHHGNRARKKKLTSAVLSVTWPNFIHLGDSLTYGNDTPEDSWTVFLEALTGQTHTNVAVNGRTAPEVTTGYAAEVHPTSPLVTGTPKMATLLIGNNDIGQGHSAATIYADTKAIWARLRAEGHYVVAMPVPDSGNWSAPQQVVRAALNALLQSDPTLYDYYFDLEAIITDPPTQLHDGTHFNVATQELVAATLFAELAAEFGW